MPGVFVRLVEEGTHGPYKGVHREVESEGAVAYISSVAHPDGSSESRGYYGLRHTTTNRLNQTQTRYLNAAGWVMKSVDNANTPVDFPYWPFGDLKTTQVNNDVKTLVGIFRMLYGKRFFPVSAH